MNIFTGGNLTAWRPTATAARLTLPPTPTPTCLPSAPAALPAAPMPSAVLTTAPPTFLAAPLMLLKTPASAGDGRAMECARVSVVAVPSVSITAKSFLWVVVDKNLLMVSLLKVRGPVWAGAVGSSAVFHPCRGRREGLGPLARCARQGPTMPEARP